MFISSTRFSKFTAVCCAMFTLLAVFGQARAATITVCASGCDHTTIAAAIAAAVDGDTIQLAAETYTETGIIVDKSVAIRGVAATSTIVQGAAAPFTTGGIMFKATAASATYSLENMTIENGSIAIQNDSGTLSITNVIFSNHQSNAIQNFTNGTISAITNSTFSNTLSGRAIQNIVGSIGSITDSTFDNNYGGIDNTSGTITTISNVTIVNSTQIAGLSNSGTITTINNSTISGNAAPSSDGAGIRNTGTITTIRNTTIANNTSGVEGGGIANLGTITAITNTTISGNAATGALNPAVAGRGGGITNLGTITAITHTTITGNTANQEGGGIMNSAATVTHLQNSIVSGNTAATGNNECDFVGATPITSGGFNVFGSNGTDGGCIGTAVDEILAGATSSLLGPLANNGGPTQTHALIDGSIAVDLAPNGANDCGTTITTDQRGETRPINTNCDAGAYEIQPTPDPIDDTPNIAIAPQENINLTTPLSPVDGCWAGNGLYGCVFDGNSGVLATGGNHRYSANLQIIINGYEFCISGVGYVFTGYTVNQTETKHVSNAACFTYNPSTNWDVYRIDFAVVPVPTEAECVIPESGPWPPCATGSNSQPTEPECVIPESGSWPPCATDGDSQSTKPECVIPESGPWPPCATDGNSQSTEPECVIPESGPWPPCATGQESQPAEAECVIPESGPWPPCATGKNDANHSANANISVTPQPTADWALYYAQQTATAIALQPATTISVAALISTPAQSDAAGGTDDAIASKTTAEAPTETDVADKQAEPVSGSQAEDPVEIASVIEPTFTPMQIQVPLADVEPAQELTNAEAIGIGEWVLLGTFAAGSIMAFGILGGMALRSVLRREAD